MEREDAKKFLYERLGHFKGVPLTKSNIDDVVLACNFAIRDLAQRKIYLTDSVMPGFIAGVQHTKNDDGNFSLMPVYQLI